MGKYDKRKYDKDATERLDKAAGRYLGNPDAVHAEDFLTVMDIELGKGADPTYRITRDTHSALDVLLSVGHGMSATQAANYRVAVGDLLKRALDVLPAPLHYIPDYMEPLLSPDYGKELSVAKGPVAILLDVRLSAEDMRKRLGILLANTADINSLLRPGTILKNPGTSDNPVIYVPPLLDAVRHGDYETCDTLLSLAEKKKTEDRYYELDKMLSLQLRVLCKDVEMPPWEAAKTLSYEGEYARALGDTALHGLVRQMGEARNDVDFRRQSVNLIRRLVDDGANPNVRNAEGLTPYGLACELGIKYIIKHPTIFRDDPSEEFAVPDRNGQLLMARLLDHMENAAHTNDSDYAKTKLNAFLDVYRTVRDTMPQELRAVHDSMLSDALSRAVRVSDRAVPFAALIEAGADPRYAAPGRVAAWQEAVMRYGCKKCRFDPNCIAGAFIETPIGGGPSLAETMTEDELDWLRNCGAEEAYKMSLDVEDARQESQRKIEPDGPVR